MSVKDEPDATDSLDCSDCGGERSLLGAGGHAGVARRRQPV